MLIEKRTRKAFPLNWEIYVSTESEGVGGKENFSPNFLPRDIRVGVFVGGVQWSEVEWENSGRCWWKGGRKSGTWARDEFGRLACGFSYLYSLSVSLTFLCIADGLIFVECISQSIESSYT